MFSGDSHVQQSGSETHERDEGEDEQVLQPKIKRKRSIRLRPKQEKPSLLRGETSQLHIPADRKINVKIENEQKPVIDQTKKTLPTRKNSNKANANINVPVRPTRGNSISTPSNNAPVVGNKMSEAIQRRVCTTFGPIFSYLFMH